MNVAARFVREFCVGYLAGRLASEVGLFWPLALLALWAIATTVVDRTEDRRVDR